MSAMVGRFLKMNWCEERRTIHNLQPGESARFPVKGYGNLHNHVRRLNDAYEGSRVWKLEREGKTKVVTRTT